MRREGAGVLLVLAILCGLTVRELVLIPHLPQVSYLEFQHAVSIPKKIETMFINYNSSFCTCYSLLIKLMPECVPITFGKHFISSKHFCIPVQLHTWVRFCPTIHFGYAVQLIFSCGFRNGKNQESKIIPKANFTLCNKLGLRSEQI